MSTTWLRICSPDGSIRIVKSCDKIELYSDVTISDLIPQGPTSSRPSTPVAGVASLRYNTTTELFEYYNGSAWTNMGSGTGGTTPELNGPLILSVSGDNLILSGSGDNLILA